MGLLIRFHWSLRCPTINTSMTLTHYRLPESILRGYSEWWLRSRAWFCRGRQCSVPPAFRSRLYRLGHPGLLEQLGEESQHAVEVDAEHLSDRMTSLARRRSWHIHNQRHLQAGMTTLVPVLRTEATPRRIPMTVTPIQMMVPVPVARRLLNRRG